MNSIIKFFIKTKDLILRLLTRIPFLQPTLRMQYRLRSFICVSTFIVSLISFSLAIIIAFTVYQGVIEQRAREVSHSLSRQAFNTLYLLMQKGWTSKELDELLDSTAGIKGETAYQVALYKNDGTQTDNDVLKVLQRGVVVNNSKGFLLIDIYPVEAKKVCLKCHRNERQGNILAAVRVQQDIGPTIKGIKKKFIFLFFLLSPIPFLLTSFIANFLNSRIIKATELFHQKIQDVSSIGDLVKLETNSINFGFVEFNNMLLEMNNFVERIKNVAVDKNLLERELHERKAAENALKKSENMLQAIIDAEPACVKLLDADANLLMMNKGCLSMIQVDSLNQVKGKSFLPLVTEEHRNAFKKLVEQVLNGESETLIFKIVGIKGRHLWLETHAVPFQNENDEIVALLGVTRDITERKEAEADILRLSEDLTTRNMELEFANKEMESFVYSVSHDLRAPLRIMSSFSKILIEDYVNKPENQQKDYLTRITKAAEKMTELIEDLLRLSRISKQDMDRMDSDLSMMASMILTDLREAEPGRNVEVAIAEGLRASVDPSLIRVALTNLIENSWKFTSKTTNARIEFSAFEKDGKTVYYVRDNGAGFDPSHVGRMFLPFQRLHSEMEFEGTGIGLAIVERIIHRHGGQVWAEGEVGKGTTVYFTLEV